VLYLFALNANGAALAVLAIGAVTIFITDHFIRPLFITGASRLPLVLALLGVVAGLETFGILGIFIGPTLLAVMLTIWRELSAAPDRPTDSA
jgi:predicted PurR-regulated permease PerM